MAEAETVVEIPVPDFITSFTLKPIIVLIKKVVFIINISCQYFSYYVNAGAWKTHSRHDA
jgi:hypothetical protein